MLRNKKLFAILTLVCFMFTLMPVAAMAEEETAPVVVTDADELKAAVTTASAITLGASFSVDEKIELHKPITISGGESNYCITSSAGKAFEVYADATFKDIKIVNNTNGGRCVDTRTDVSVTLENVTLEATGVNSQPLTIGGYDHGTSVTINNSSISSGKSGYAIIDFVKSTIIINNSDLSGYTTLYFKGGSKDSSVTVKDGSCLEGINSNIYGTGKDAGVNNFGTVVFEDSNITLDVDNTSTVCANATHEATQKAFLFNTGSATNNNLNINGKVTAEVKTAESLKTALADPFIEDITLLDSITTSEKITIDRDVTINGNGKTLTYTGTDRAITVENTANNANLTIKNLTVDCASESRYCQRGINYNTGGTLVLENVTVDSNHENGYATYALNLPSSSDNANVTIKKSNLTGNIALNIWGQKMTVEVNNSNLTSVDENDEENYAAVKLNNNSTDSAEGTTVTITGGTIVATDENKEPSRAISNSTETGTITYTSDVTGDEAKPVAVIKYEGNTNYSFTTLGAAISKAEAGETVILIRKIELNSTVTVPAEVNVNLNGKTITLLSDGSLTVAKDSSVVPGAASGYELVTTENSDGTITYTVKVATVAVTGISLDETAKELVIGDKLKLVATVTPENATNADVTWSTSDEKVATVDANGVVEAVAEGKATITAKAGEYSATCEVTVEAEAEPVTYSITIDPVENGTVTADKTAAAAGEKVTLEIKPADGYKIAVLQVIYSDNEPVKVDNNGFIMPEADVTVYVTFEEDVVDPVAPVTYTITIVDDATVRTQTVEYGECLTVPTAALQEGWTFIGWYASKDGGTTLAETVYDFTKPVTEMFTLHAVYELNVYTVTFDSNEGSAIEAVEVEHGEKATKPADPTRSGYTFAGWYNGETEYDFATPVTADLTLTAKWKENSSAGGNGGGYVGGGSSSSSSSNKTESSTTTTVTPSGSTVKVETETKTESDGTKVETETTTTTTTTGETTKVETTTETKTDGTVVETTTTTDSKGDTTTVEKTTETNDEGTKVETTVTTDAQGETATTVTATLDNGSAVTNNDEAVKVEVTKVEETVVTKVEEAVAADETVEVVGTADNAVSVSATNSSTGAAQSNFVQPMSVNVPVDKAVLDNVTDTSKLTMAKVVTNEDGTTELVYMGGSYDEETGTFNAKVDEDGDYILVEKADLVKIELTIDDTTVKHNDNHHEMDVAPKINAEEGRTELPLRYLGEALGFGIEWNNNVVTITKGDTVFSMEIGKEIPGFGTPYIDSDRTMVSARYISEMLGANVIWDPVDRQVIVVK